MGGGGVGDGVHVQTSSMITQSDPRTFAWTNGEIHVGRMHWLSIPETLTHHGEVTLKATLEISQPGLLNTLRWASPPMKPLQPDEVLSRSTFRHGSGPIYRGHGNGESSWCRYH